MAESSKKQNFLHGAALLAIATAVVKLIGAFYKIPLKMVIGDQGYGYFITAYDIYTVLLMISTAGLPIAMSRMISQANALNHNNQIRRVYKTAQAIFLGLGVVSTGLMMLFCHELAQFQGQPDAWAAKSASSYPVSNCSNRTKAPASCLVQSALLFLPLLFAITAFAASKIFCVER